MQYYTGEYRPSRCTNPDSPPQTWHWARIDGDPKLVMAEFYDAIRQNVDAKAYIDAKAELAAVLERVLSCRAADPGDITNVARFRDLWEIRIQLGSFGLLMRIYETELDVLPVHIVALRAHAKKVAKLDREQIAELQNDEIDIAIRRWQRGRNDLWGLR